jgi:hypothetical protein
MRALYWTAAHDPKPTFTKTKSRGVKLGGAPISVCVFFDDSYAPQAAVYLFRMRSPHHMPVIRDREHLMDRKTLFEAKRPQFTEYEAHELWQKYGEIVSVDGRPAALDSFRPNADFEYDTRYKHRPRQAIRISGPGQAIGRGSSGCIH